jgi:uncharacterized membrane protein
MRALERYLPFVVLAAVFILFSSGRSGWGSGMMGGGMWFIWIAIAAGMYLLLSGTPFFRGGGRHRALKIAEERYARGEISAEELDEIRDTLGYD